MPDNLETEKRKSREGRRSTLKDDQMWPMRETQTQMEAPETERPVKEVQEEEEKEVRKALDKMKGGKAC